MLKILSIHVMYVCMKEFHPNMVIERCRFNRPIMSECFGDEALRSLGHHVRSNVDLT